MSEEVAQDRVDTPGLQLTAARERAGWSLLQVADKLHLDVSTVRALEADDFAALGALVYVRGHLRRYGELLGMPAGDIEVACARAMRVDEAAYLKRIARGQARSTGRSLTVPPAAAAVAAAIVVVLALIWWAMRMPHRGRPATSDTVPASAPHP
jgi:cytoskeleton protein RodZ